MRVSVVVPCFNEAESLPQLLAEIAAVRTAASVSEVIVVDDGSRDAGFAVVRTAAVSDSTVRGIRLQGNRGKAAALAAGFAAATGDVVVTLDADLQDDPAEIPKLLVGLSTADVVVGRKTPRLDPWTKVLPSRIFNALVHRLTGLALHDVNSGAKAMRRAVVRQLTLYGELHRFIPVLAYAAGFRVAEVAVRHRPRRFGQSKYGARRFARGLFDLATVTFLSRYGARPLHLFGGVGVIAVSVGVAFGVYLSVLRFRGETIGDRPLLLLTVLLIIAGFQLIFTGFLAELFVRGQGAAAPPVAERVGFPHESRLG